MGSEATMRAMWDRLADMQRENDRLRELAEAYKSERDAARKALSLGQKVDE